MVLENDVLETLKNIGLHNPDPADPLHKRLVQAVRRTRGGNPGVTLVAMKFEFNWELVEAGKEFAKLKTEYEHFLDRETIKTIAQDPSTSRALAEQMARSTDEAYELHLKYRLAEKREQAMRKFLDTLDNSVEVWRSENANQRAADSFTAREGI